MMTKCNARFWIGEKLDIKDIIGIIGEMQL